MPATLTPVKDTQTVTPEGKIVAPRIEGLNIRKLNPLEDHRGELIEVFRDSWNFHPDPLVYVYHVLARPKSVRGWVMHKKQDDRIVCLSGVLQWAFFDDRPDSPTYQLVNVLTFGKRSPVLFTIPKNVYHAVKNIGTEDALFINMPTRPYDHANPDKYRLPMKNSMIPFDFE